MTLTLTNQEKQQGWLYLLLQLLVVPYAAAHLCRMLGSSSVTAANLVGFFANALLAAVFFRALLAQSWQRFAAGWGRTLTAAAEGFALYWLLSALITALIRAVRPEFANINDVSIRAMIEEAPVLMPLAVVFAAPLAEECLCRGWIFTGLAQRSVPLAYCATAAFFAAMHMADYVGVYDPVTLVLCCCQYIGPGLVLCRTCRRADNLMAPLLLHMTINTIALFTTR